MIKQLLMLSLMIANLQAADQKKPVIPKISIDSENKLIADDILRLRKINNPTAKALLEKRIKELKQRMNEGRDKNDTIGKKDK